MPQSQDIVILDDDDKVNVPNEKVTDGNSENITVKANNTVVKFDDILNESSKLAQVKQQKMPQNRMKLSKNAINVPQRKGNNDTIGTNSEIKQNTIYIIQKYQSSDRFGNFVKNELKINYSSDNLQRKSTKELENILSKIRVHLDNKNMSKIYDGILFSSTMLVEKLSKPIVNVDGYSKMLLESEEFLNCFDRVKCETIMPTIPSHLQLFFILAQTYFMAYATNKIEKSSPEVDAIIAEVEREIASSKESETNDTKEEKKEENSEEIIKPIISEGMSI